MSILVSGVVGDQGVLSDGANNKGFRQSTEGALISGEGNAKLYEASARGGIFETATQATGFVNSGVNTVGAFSGGASVITLYNPDNSGVNLSVIQTRILQRSGTPGAGPWVYIMHRTAAFSVPTGIISTNLGTAGLTPQGSYASNAVGRGMILHNRAIGSTDFKVLRPMGVFFAAAITATTEVMSIIDQVDGEIVLPPGCAVSIVPNTAGTSHTFHLGMTWEEIPL